MVLDSGRYCPRCEERQTAAAEARTEAVAAQPADDVLAAPVAPVVLPAPHPAAVVHAPRPAPADIEDDQELVLEDLTRAAADHQVVFDHVDRYGEASAQRLFTRSFVATVQRLSGLGHLDLGYITLGQA